MSIRDLTRWNRSGKPSLAEGDYRPIQTLHDRMDRIFDEWFANLPESPYERNSQTDALLARCVDVLANRKAYLFSLELPGFDEKDVQVTISDGVLTIRGEKKSESTDRKDHEPRIGRTFGVVQRCFVLPSDIEDDEVKATFKNGVLTVVVPKSEKVKTTTKQIEVQSA